MLPAINILLLIGFVITGASAALDIYILRRFPLYVFVFPPLAFMFILSLIRWYSEESIRTYYERNKSRSEKIRRINNQVIKGMLPVLQKAKYPPEKCKFTLYNADYENITIKKKPRLYRGYYEVYPGTSR